MIFRKTYKITANHGTVNNMATAVGCVSGSEGQFSKVSQCEVEK